MSETTYKRKRGDRRDGRWIKDLPGLSAIMPHLMDKRTDAEVNLTDRIDCTELMKYLEVKNAEHPNFKTTIFHCLIVALARVCRERPKMNRFVAGRRVYERDEVSLSFTAKRRFADHAEESLMVFVPKDTDTLYEVSHKIYGDVTEMRKSEHSTGGVDQLMDKLGKLPRPILSLIVHVVKFLDFFGMNPDFITDGDPNYTTVLASNLGSIKCPAVYHHLNNYGTCSIMITLGTLHKEPVLMPNGEIEVRDIVDFSVTLDERIADGFYFARSLKLVQHLFAHPEMFDIPLGVPSGFDYK